MSPATSRGSSTANLMQAGPHSDAPNSHDAARLRRALYGADIFGRDVDIRGRSDPVRQPDTAAVEHDDAPGGINEARNARHTKDAPTGVRRETRSRAHHQDIQVAAAVGLICQMYAGALCIMGRRNGSGTGERCRDGRHSALRSRLPARRRVRPAAVASAPRSAVPPSFLIAGKQQAADQIPAVHLAQRIEFDKASGVTAAAK